MLMKEMSNEHFTRSRKLELDTPVVVEESIRILAPSNISKTGKKKSLWCPAEMMSLFRTELDMEGKIKYKTLMSMAQVSKVQPATYCKRMNAFVAAHNYNSLADLKRDIPAAVRVTKFSHDYLIAGGWTQLRAEGRVCYLSPSEELAIAAVLLEFSCSGTALTFEMFQAWVLMIAAGADQLFFHLLLRRDLPLLLHRRNQVPQLLSTLLNLRLLLRLLLLLMIVR